MCPFFPDDETVSLLHYIFAEEDNELEEVGGALGNGKISR